MVKCDVLQGDAYTTIRELAKDSSHQGRYKLIVTSPPYYGHRHYGENTNELGQEKTEEDYIEKLKLIFTECRKLLSEDGSLWIVIGDTRRKYGKLMIPHRLALKLIKSGYTLREDIIWYKKNNVSSSSKENFSQAYELILFLSKNERSFTNIDTIRTKGNEAREGRNKTPPKHLLQLQPLEQDKKKIQEIKEIIYNSTPETAFTDLPTTSEISWAYGYDPEKYCPTCFRKFKRHATRKRIGDHKHYPIFAVCNSNGKNPGNVWEISTKAHYGNEHFAIYPEDLISRIIKFGTEKGDWVLDPFVGRGTTGIVCAALQRNFTGIDLYEENMIKSKKNIDDSLAGKIKIKFDLEEEGEPQIKVASLEDYLISG